MLQLGSYHKGWAGLLPPPDDSGSEDQGQLPARNGVSGIMDGKTYSRQCCKP